LILQKEKAELEVENLRRKIEEGKSEDVSNTKRNYSKIVKNIAITALAFVGGVVICLMLSYSQVKP